MSTQTISQAGTILILLAFEGWLNAQSKDRPNTGSPS